ncbi:MAG: hypothetical protein AAF389_09250 [Gemmatimonadota bacterium]
MIAELTTLVGPLATWVLVLGILPATGLFAGMWTLGRLTDWSTQRALARRTPSLPRSE